MGSGLKLRVGKMKNKIKVFGVFILFIYLFIVMNSVTGDILDKEENITLDSVMVAFENVDDIIVEMKMRNFSVSYVEDSLLEMNRVFEQVSYAEILRNGSLSHEAKAEAAEALKLIKWQNLEYNDVMVYYYDIVARRDLAFLLWDKIIIEEPPPGSVSLGNVQILEDAKAAFYEERFSETEDLIKVYRVSVEKDRADRTVFAGVQRGAKNFFQEHWIFVLVGFVLVGFMVFFLRKNIVKRILKNKILKMETERTVLKDLIRKVQVERFKKRSLSGLVYDIRMKKYGERLTEINGELPVLRARLAGGDKG